MALNRLSASVGTPLNVAVVGASGGLGQVFVEQLCSLPTVNSVYALSRSAFDTEQAGLSSKVCRIEIDITDEASIANAASGITVPLHMLLVTTGFLHDEAGRTPEKRVQELDQEGFIKSQLINALGPALVAKHCLPLFHKGGKSIFAALSARVGSIADNRLGGWYSYRASKASLNMLLKNLAIEYQRKLPDSIIVGLHPGTVDTALSKPFQGRVPTDKLFSPADSVRKLMSVIDGLEKDDTGKIIAWDGQVVPY